MPVSISTVKSPEVERIGRPQAVAKLNVVEIGENLVVQERQPVADAEVAFESGESRLAARQTRE